MNTISIPAAKKTWSLPVYTVTIGATKSEGGSRNSIIKVGGETTLPFHYFEGELPNPPKIAIEIWDTYPEDWHQIVKEPYADVLDNPGSWARRCEEYGADLICLKLIGCHPDKMNRSPEEAAAVVREVLSSTGLPLIIWGCGDSDKDNEVFPIVAEACAGENCLLGTITEKNYKTLTALATAYNHKLIAESPCDVNIAKQVNILAMEMGYNLSNIIIFPMTGALGYGIEYVYSVMERIRIAGLQGDKMLAMPFILDVGIEAWKTKEAKAENMTEEWGEQRPRAIAWEASTAYLYILSGADIIIMRHPEAVKAVKEYIRQLTRQI